MKDIIKFLRSIWSKHCQVGDYVFLSFKKGKKWIDIPYLYNKSLNQKLAADLKKYSPDKWDVYFCPTPFTGKRRLKKLMPRTKFLWADLDEVNPSSLPIDLRPTISWKTSPNRYQSLWLLKEPISNIKADKLNKALTYNIGADKGGWNIGQVIRVPGTYNHKYDSNPKVTIVDFKPTLTYDIIEIENQLKVGEVIETEVDSDRPASQLKGQKVLNEYRDIIPEDIRSLLTAKQTEGDRSAVIWRIENELYDIGLSPPEIIALVRDSVWNKYKGRNDENKRLRTELMKIIKGENLPRERLKDFKKSELKLESFSDVVGSFSNHPGWLVKGFWARRSHGIVAGEPKSFKSTIVLDLALSVASGKPFLEEYPVEEKGPVIIVQNENASWIMKDRLQKMIANKGLGGKVKKSPKDDLLIQFPEDLPIHFINQQMFLFNDLNHQQKIEELVDEINPVLIIFDPLYLMFDGDVSSAKDLNPALNWFLNLKNRTNTGILLIHHWNKAQTSSRGGQKMLGSTTLHGWVESAWYIEVGSDNGGGTNDITEVNSKPSKIILEREFRSAGAFPKIDVEILMGKIGDPKYEIKTSVHKKKKGGVPSEDLEKQVIDYLKLKKGKVTQKELLSNIGVKRKILSTVLDELADRGELEYSRTGVQLVKGG